MAKLAAALVFLLSLVSGWAAPLRWAILGDTGPQAMKTADLLLAGLSENPEMVFVERESIKEITKELELNALIQAGGSGRRASLLGLMKADRLMVLSSRSSNGQNTLQVVIAESTQGARLAAMEFRVNPEQELVGRLIRLIQTTNQHYAGGIKAVVGVAPLTPENLEQGDDHLSTTYRDLLQGEFSLLPGVAVIELDEARAIAAEMAISGGDVGARTTPVLIDGTYKTVRNGGDVTLNLKITQGAEVLASIRKDMPRKEVASFFRKEVSSRALRHQVKTGDVSVDDQFHWLVTQAEGFSRLGLYPRAAGLREAALLLKPEESRVRISLIADYREIYSNVRIHMLSSVIPNTPPKDFPDDEQVSRCVSTYETALQHIAYLIMNRQIDRELAADLIVNNSAMGLIHAFPYKSRSKGEVKFVRAGAKILLRAEDAEFAMHQLVMPVYFTLPIPPENQRGLGMANFDNSVMNSYLKRIDSSEKTSKQLDECLYYFNELFPDDKWMSYGMATFIGADRRDWAGLSLIGDARWLSFLDRLSQSKKTRVRLLAEYGKIRFMIMEGKEMSATEKAALAARIKKWWLATGQPLHWTNHHYFSEPVFEDMRGILNKLEIRGELVSSLPPERVKPANWQTDPSTWEYWGCPYMLGHLRFKELSIKTTTPLPPKLSFTKGDNRADYLWDKSGIWRLDSQLYISRIAAEVALPVRAVEWDGDHLWVLSGPNNGKSEHSLSVFDGMGSRLAGLGPGDFSAHDDSMRIIVIRKGVACVAGTFRPYNRTWLALAILSGGKIAIKEFHHAKDLPTGSSNSTVFGNPHLAFVPTWMRVMSLEPGQPESLLIGRDRTATEEKWHPLMINTQTLEVAVHPYRIWCGYANRNHLCHDGMIFSPNDCSVSVFPRVSGKITPTGGRQQEVPSRQICEKGGSFVTQFIHQGQLHVIGYKWIRVDISTLKEEEISLGIIPPKWRMQWYDSSDNHEILGFKDGKLYSITFADDVLFAEDE